MMWIWRRKPGTRVRAVTGLKKSPADGTDWHLVRIPHPSDLFADQTAMHAWCAAEIGEDWYVEPKRPSGTAYRFARRADALRFARRWFPFTCG